MQTAIYLPTGEVISARRIAQQERETPGARDQYDGKLICRAPQCRQSAHYCSPASNGRRACFRINKSTPHAPGCSMEGGQGDTVPGRLRQMDPPVFSDGDVLQLDLRSGADETRRHVDGDDPLAPETYTVASHTDEDTGRRAQRHRMRLVRMLADLIREPESFTDPEDVVITTPHRGRISASGLIWHFHDFDPKNRRMIGKHVVVWGQADSAAEGAFGGFFNEGPRENSLGAIHLDEGEVQRLVSRHAADGVQSFRDFTGWHVIAYGRASAMASGRQVQVKPEPGGVAAIPPAGHKRPRRGAAGTSESQRRPRQGGSTAGDRLARMFEERRQDGGRREPMSLETMRERLDRIRRRTSGE